MHRHHEELPYNHEVSGHFEVKVLDYTNQYDLFIKQWGKLQYLKAVKPRQ